VQSSIGEERALVNDGGRHAAFSIMNAVHELHHLRAVIGPHAVADAPDRTDLEAERLDLAADVTDDHVDHLGVGRLLVGEPVVLDRLMELFFGGGGAADQRSEHRGLETCEPEVIGARHLESDFVQAEHGGFRWGPLAPRSVRPVVFGDFDEPPIFTAAFRIS
jgi:hypothetical protein